MDYQVKRNGKWIDREESEVLNQLLPWYKNLFAKKKFTVREVKKVLKEQTHGGKYWGAKPHYNPFTATVTIVGPSDRVWVNIVDGLAYYEDKDVDGCSEDRSCKLILKKQDNGQLKLYRKK